MRRKFGGGSKRGIPSEIGLSSGVNRINAGGRITSEQIILWLEIAISVNIKDQYSIGKRTFKSFMMPLRKI